MKSGIVCVLALFGVAVTSTTANAGKPVRPPAAPPTLAYYAANDAVVGPFYNGLTVMTMDGRTFLLGVDYTFYKTTRSGAMWTLRGDLLFDTDGCVGTSYIDRIWDTAGFNGVAKVNWDGQAYQLHVSEYDLGQSVIIESYLRNGVCEDENSGSSVLLYPVQATYNLDTIFPLPLTIR